MSDVLFLFFNCVPQNKMCIFSEILISLLCYCMSDLYSTYLFKHPTFCLIYTVKSLWVSIFIAEEAEGVPASVSVCVHVMMILQRVNPQRIEVIFASFKRTSFIYSERSTLNDSLFSFSVVHRTTTLHLLITCSSCCVMWILQLNMLSCIVMETLSHIIVCVH